MKHYTSLDSVICNLFVKWQRNWEYGLDVIGLKRTHTHHECNTLLTLCVQIEVMYVLGMNSFYKNIHNFDLKIYDLHFTNFARAYA